jgi:replication initiation and membrane attachment protein DnaB
MAMQPNPQFNYTSHLTAFFEKALHDKEINATYISLYMTLFQFWNFNRFKNPVGISREEVMQLSKISSKATYHKGMKTLHANGYIKYDPSFNPFRGSHVVILHFSNL